MFDTIPQCSTQYLSVSESSHNTEYYIPNCLRTGILHAIDDQIMYLMTIVLDMIADILDNNHEVKQNRQGTFYLYYSLTAQLDFV